MEGNKSKTIKIWKIGMLFIVVIILIYATYSLMPIMQNITTTEGRLNFRSKILQSGVRGCAILFGLELAQIVLAILPRRTIRNFSRYVLWKLGRCLILNNFYFNYNTSFVFFSKKIWHQISL